MLVKNLIMLDLGLTLGLPTILVPALTGILNEHNQNEFLLISAEQATWIGKLFLHRSVQKFNQK